MTGNSGRLLITAFREEVVRQRRQFWWLYRLRWTCSWAVLAFVLRLPKTGWYLARGSKSGYCTVSGPFNTRRQAQRHDRTYPKMFGDTSAVCLLWEEPPNNRDERWRTAGRYWYRLPVRTRE